MTTPDPWMTVDQVAEFGAMKPPLKLVPHEEPLLSGFDRLLVGRFETVRLDLPVTDLALLTPSAELLEALARELRLLARRPLPSPRAVEYERERRMVILSAKAICDSAKAHLRRLRKRQSKS